MFLFFLVRAQQVSCGEITVLTSTKKKVRRVLARKSLPRTNQNSPSAFSHQIRNNSKKDKTKTSQMMGWIENRPNKFLNQNFVRQGLPAKCKSVRFRLISLMCPITLILFISSSVDPPSWWCILKTSPIITNVFNNTH
jgi:hypothetical protein